MRSLESRYFNSAIGMWRVKLFHSAAGLIDVVEYATIFERSTRHIFVMATVDMPQSSPSFWRERRRAQTFSEQNEHHKRLNAVGKCGLANSLQAYLAPASRYRRHGRIRRVVRKGWSLADNGTPVAERPSRVVGWRSGSCAGRMSADSSKYIRRCYIKPLKFVQYTEVISVNLCSTETGNDINSHTSLRTEIKTYKIRCTKRKTRDYIAVWRELCYTVAQKELLYA